MSNKIISVKTNKLNYDTKNVYLDISIISKKNNSLLSNSEYKIAANVDTAAVKNSLRNIFTWIPGERILNPEFGNHIYNYIYDSINKYNVEQICAEINKSILNWEPRAIVDDIQEIKNTDDTEDNTINIKIIYHIAGLPSNIYKDFIII